MFMLQITFKNKQYQKFALELKRILLYENVL